MVRFTFARSNSLCGLPGIAIIVALVGCSSSGGKTNGPSTANPVGNSTSANGATGSSGGSLGGGTAVSGGGSGPGSGSGTVGSTSSGSSGTSTSRSSGGSSGASSNGSSGGSSVDGGPSTGTASADAGDAAVTLGMCMPAEITPCGSYASPAEDGGMDIIQLGPYGAQGDPNVGTGFANDVQSSDQQPQPSSACQGFAQLFGETQMLTDLLLQTTKNGVTIDFSLYSAYRPAIWPSTPVPVITWGNGTCAQPEGYGALLRYVASYGYFVIAANSRQVASTNADGSHVMMRALDYAAAANKDPSSPYYGKLDMTKVGAMGHSQGGGETITVANMDTRILYALPFNGGDTGVQKPYLAVSGDMDVTGASVQSMTTDVNGASVPAAWLYYHNPVGNAGDALKGHLVLMLTPERVDPQTIAWWEMWFRNDATSKTQFIGSSCGFCGHASDQNNSYDYGHDSMLQ